MAYKHLVMKVNNTIALVETSKPESLNALGSEVITGLNDYFRKLDSDQEIEVVITTGEGGSFVAGADITEMSSLSTTEGNSFAKKGTGTFLLIEKLSKPVITTINGFAPGGGYELSLACDIRVTSKKALMGQSEVGLGITPRFGGTQRLVWTIRPGRTKELIFGANNIEADEALEIGLVNRAVEPEGLMDETMKIAEEIASKFQPTVRYAKQAINNGLQTDIGTGMDIERVNFTLCSATEDQKKGMKTLLERRKPDLRGY